MYRYIEFGAVVADGPHLGTVAATFHTREAAERWRDNPPPWLAGQKFVIHQREVTKTDWQVVPLLKSPIQQGEPSR